MRDVAWESDWAGGQRSWLFNCTIEAELGLVMEVCLPSNTKYGVAVGRK